MCECWGNPLCYCLPPAPPPHWRAVGLVKSHTQARPVKSLCSLSDACCLSWPNDYHPSTFSLLWPSLWGWEGEHFPTLFFIRGLVNAPSSGLAVWQSGRVTQQVALNQRGCLLILWRCGGQHFRQQGALCSYSSERPSTVWGLVGLVFKATLMFQMGACSLCSELVGPVS